MGDVVEAIARCIDDPSKVGKEYELGGPEVLTYEEIVDVTGLPLGTVKNRLFRAREMMRQQFVTKGITGV